MRHVRTPDDRFEQLEGFPFPPHYVQVPDGEGTGGELRMHFVDEGGVDEGRRATGETILCLHGQPTWSYLYRKMIPPFVAAGHRVVAPDLIGFGRSDKPVAREDYTYARHVGWMNAFIEALDLRDITLVCQDWGGLIGLRCVADQPGRFARVVVANTGLPDARGMPDSVSAMLHAAYAKVPVLDIAQLGRALSGEVASDFPTFMYWVKFCAETPELVVSDVVAMSARRALPEPLARAYDAPFPNEQFKAGARQFPSLVPIIPDNPAIADNRRAWAALATFDKPFLTAFSDGDPIPRGGEARFRADVPGAAGQAHVTIAGAGHFLQEDKGEELADVVLRFIAANLRPAG
jgi:haloalkane dehalogenase